MSYQNTIYLFGNEPKKPELKSIGKLEEIKNTYLLLNAGDEYKRKRDDFASSLRKKGRDQLVKQKRGMTTADENNLNKLLSNLSQMTFTAADIPRLAGAIHSTSENEVHIGVVGLRRLLATEGPSPIQEIIDAGTVPMLVALLNLFNKPHLQLEAAWCLTNIATGTTDQTQCVIDKGAVPKFIELLSSPFEKIQDQAIWALGNISGENAKCRDLVSRAGIIPPLVKLLSEMQNPNVVKNGVWALSNLCRGKPAPCFDNIKPLIPTFARLIKDSDCEKDTLADCCWALSYISDGGCKRIPFIIKEGIVPDLVRLLDHSNPSVSTPALRILGNIITGDDEQTQIVIEAGCLIPMEKLLYNPKISVRKETCWAISNITAGNSSQIEAVMKTNIIGKLLDIIKEDSAEVRREAVWAISNSTTSSTIDQICRMVELGVIETLCSLFVFSESRTLSIVLEGLENLLKKGNEVDSKSNPIAIKMDECGGLKDLEKLQMHNNGFIYNKSVKIMEQYFGMEDVHPMNIPQSDSSIFSF